MADLAAPVRVSPLIRFGRWGLLTTGILYGLFHQSRLSKRETAIREVEEKQRPVREAKIAEERKFAAEKELKELGEAVGVVF